MNRREKARVKMLLNNLGGEIMAMRRAHQHLTGMLDMIGTDGTDITPLGLSRRADEAAAGCASAARYGFREISGYCNLFKNQKEPT